MSSRYETSLGLQEIAVNTNIVLAFKEDSRAGEPTFSSFRIEATSKSELVKTFRFVNSCPAPTYLPKNTVFETTQVCFKVDEVYRMTYQKKNEPFSTQFDYPGSKIIELWNQSKTQFCGQEPKHLEFRLFLNTTNQLNLLLTFYKEEPR